MGDRAARRAKRQAEAEAGVEEETKRFGTEERATPVGISEARQSNNSCGAMRAQPD